MILHTFVKKTHRAILLSGLFFFVPFSLIISPALAETKKNTDKWYEVEVIVFANNDKTVQETEKWPEKPGTPQIKNVLELFSPAELLTDDVDQLPMYYVEPLEQGEDNLAKLAVRIEKSDAYSLLIHRTWRQTVSRRKTGFPVYLSDNNSDKLYQTIGEVEDPEEEIGEISPEQLLLEALLAEESNLQEGMPEVPFFIHQLDPIVPFEETDGLPSSVPVQLSPMGPPDHSVFGTLKFFKNRYLHVAVDFSYRPDPYEPEVEELSLEEVFPMAKTNDQDSLDEPLINNEQLIKSEDLLSLSNQEKPPLVGFRLKGSKRIRLNEVHYFDHPTFGVIVRAISYVEPEPEPETEAEDENQQ